MKPTRLITPPASCEEVAALAVDLDQGPPARPQARATLEAHLVGCPACRQLVAAQTVARQRVGRLAAVPPPAPPAALEAQLADRLRQRTGRPPARRSRRVLAGAGLLLMASAAAAYLVLRVEPTTITPTGGPGAPTPPSELVQDLRLPAGARGDAAGPGRRFRPIGWLEAERPLEAARVTRVELRAEAAAAFGWPVTPDLPGGRVQAEILYGEDGLARGLRFLPATFHVATEGTK